MEQLNKGFSTLEMMVAMAILAITLTAVVLVLFGNQSLGSDSQLNAEALGQTQALLEKAQALARKDFNLLNPTNSTVTIDGFTYNEKTVIERPSATDFFTKRIKATVSWVGDHNRLNQNVSLTSLVTNFPNVVGGNACFSELSGNWSSPSHNDYAFVAGNLLPGSPPPSHTFSSSNPILSVDMATTSAAITVGNTGVKTDDTVFFFGVATPGVKPQYISSFDNATTSIVGPSAVHIAGNYAYVANSTPPLGTFGTCINADDLSSLSTTYASNCSQLQVVDIGTLSAPKLVYNFKVPGITGIGGVQGTGKSIFYHDGYVYVGLVTGAGPEFNIIDVHNPTLPIARGSFLVGNTINSIYVSGYYAYLATDNNSKQLMVLDISNPNAPKLATGAPYNPGGANFGNSVYGVGDWLYFGNTGPSPQLSILNIADPTTAMPTPTPPTGAILPVANGVAALIARDTLAFVLNSTINKLQIFTVARPTDTQTTPILLSSVTVPGNGAALDCVGNYLYAGSNSGSNGFISVIGS